MPHDKLFFYHDPYESEYKTFETEHERDEHLKETIMEYVHDGCLVDMGDFFVGQRTHMVKEKRIATRPPEDEIDENGFDTNGMYWDADWEYLCSPEIVPLRKGNMEFSCDFCGAIFPDGVTPKHMTGTAEGGICPHLHVCDECWEEHELQPIPLSTKEHGARHGLYQLAPTSFSGSIEFVQIRVEDADVGERSSLK